LAPGRNDSQKNKSKVKSKGNGRSKGNGVDDEAVR
jgi:hypothetical protein